MVKPYNGNKFYNGNDLLKTGSTWLACIGRRSNGKSFWWLQFFIIDCLEHGNQMAYVRRQDNEVKKKSVDRYFEDDALVKWLQKNYDYDGILCDKDDLFFFKRDEKGKPVKGTKLGNVFSVSTARNYKSLHFDKIYNVLYEEFITDGLYIDHEWNNFNSILSTIFRLRMGRVVLIGNTISRACPYFDEMGVDIRKLQQGTINTIKHTKSDGTHVYLSIEYSPDIDTKNGIFFGKAEKSINNGVWESEEYPHIFFDLDKAEKLYTFYMVHGDFCFKAYLLSYQDKIYTYVYPYDADKLEYNNRDDIFYNGFTTRDNVFNGARKKRHGKIWECLTLNRVLYSDNLTGTEFNKCLKSFNPFLLSRSARTSQSR